MFYFSVLFPLALIIQTRLTVYCANKVLLFVDIMSAFSFYCSFFLFFFPSLFFPPSFSQGVDFIIHRNVIANELLTKSYFGLTRVFGGRFIIKMSAVSRRCGCYERHVHWRCADLCGFNRPRCACTKTTSSHCSRTSLCRARVQKSPTSWSSRRVSPTFVHQSFITGHFNTLTSSIPFQANMRTGRWPN